MEIGSNNVTKLKAEDKFVLPNPIYQFQDETSFHKELKEKHTKAVKNDDAEVESRIWDNAQPG